MALFASYVTFRQPADGSTGIQSITGVGFQGKALLIWSTLTPGHVATTAANQLLAMTDGVAQSVSSIAHPGGSGGLSGDAESNDCIVFVVNATSGATPSVRTRATFQSWTAEGFTLNWTINTIEPLGRPLFHALVLGGPDIQVALKRVQITVNAGQTIAVSGVGFQPDSFIVMGGGGEAVGGYTQGAPFGGMHGFGFSNATENTCGLILGRGVDPSDNYASLHTNRVTSIREVVAPGAAEICGWTITATSGDGFTLTRVTGTAAVIAPWQAILCIQGALFSLGTFEAPASVGTLTVPLAFRAGLLIAQTHGSTSLNTTLAGLHLMIGAWVTRVGQGGTWIGGPDGTSPTVYNRSSNRGYLIQTRHPTTRAVTCQASVTRSTPSGVTLTFNVTAPMTFIYLALGSVVARGQTPMFTTGGTTGPLSWMELMLKTDAE